MIGPVYGTVVVMAAVFVALAVPFVCVFVCWYSRNRGELTIPRLLATWFLSRLAYF